MHGCARLCKKCMVGKIESFVGGLQARLVRGQVVPSLVERLRKKTPGQQRYGQARRIVQIKRQEIAEALKDGFAVKDIWRYFVEEEGLTIQYRAFCNQVRKLIQDSRTEPAATLGSDPDGAAGNMEVTTVPSVQPTDQEPHHAPEKPRKTFKWNPSPKIEDFV